MAIHSAFFWIKLMRAACLKLKQSTCPRVPVMQEMNKNVCKPKCRPTRQQHRLALREVWGKIPWEDSSMTRLRHATMENIFMISCCTVLNRGNILFLSHANQMFQLETREAARVGKFNKNLSAEEHPHGHAGPDRHGPCWLLKYGAEHLSWENKQSHYWLAKSVYLCIRE